MGLVLLLWNPELQNTPRRTLKTMEFSLLRQRVQGESVPNKDPDVSERPSFISTGGYKNWSPWTLWHNRLYSTVLSVLRGVFCNSGFHISGARPGSPWRDRPIEPLPVVRLLFYRLVLTGGLHKTGRQEGSAQVRPAVIVEEGA